jgi:hypothetical protein
MTMFFQKFPAHSTASLNRALRLLLWCALVIGIAITALGVRQVDLWWQLPEGLSILHDGRLPHEPPAAFGLPHLPYVDEYSLYEISLALLYRTGGFIAIWLAFVSAYLLVFVVPLAETRGARRDLLSLAFLALAGIFMVNRYEQRPEIVGALLLALLLQLLRHTEKFSSGFLLRLALLFAIWTNVHSSFVVGLLALFFWLLERVCFATGPARWSVRRAAITLGTAAAAVLINPYGVRRIAFAIGQERDLGSNLLSREMWPAWDQSMLTQALLLTSAALMAVAFLARNRPAPWLIAFACAMFALSLHSIRHMSFFAVALLYISAERKTDSPAREGDPALAALLGTACIFAFIFDFTSLRRAVGEIMTSPARTDQAFAPSLVNMLRTRGPGAVLCHDAEGSYLTFAGGGDLRPLLDSGQGHFDNATKRFYFFIEQDPRAFDLALERLDVDNVLVTRPAAAWVLELAGRPEWHLAAWTDDGLFFARGPMPVAANWSQRDQLRELHGAVHRLRDPVWAFCLSTLVDDPEGSLTLLDRSRADSWSETFLNFLRPWLDSVPVEEFNAFLKDHPGAGNPLLRELVQMRTRLQAPLPDAGSSRLAKMVRVLDLLQRGDVKAARETFAALPHPMLSTLYDDLRDQLEPSASKNDDAAEKWQDWNAGGAELFRQMPPALNRRIAAPTEASMEIR